MWYGSESVALCFVVFFLQVVYLKDILWLKSCFTFLVLFLNFSLFCFACYFTEIFEIFCFACYFMNLIQMEKRKIILCKEGEAKQRLEVAADFLRKKNKGRQEGTNRNSK